MRSRIAAQAARLMAEDGIDNLALAKRKAARQLGAPSSQSLPNNDEVEAELESYRQLFQGRQHAALTLKLRRKALMAMRFFEKFDPYLTGSVLKGSAGPHSAVNVQLFAANEKELELFLLNLHIPFDSADAPHLRGGRNAQTCMVRIDWEGTPLHLGLHEPAELRGALKAGAAAERAGIAAVERLIEAATAHLTP
jgi:hypothetical protein